MLKKRLALHSSRQYNTPLEIVESRNKNLLVPILHDADEDDVRIASAIVDMANISYAAYIGDECVGAAMMHWQLDESEILYIAIRAADRGKGYGRELIAAIVNMARERSTQALVVGTASTSVDNILFYQKCGFRMDSVRKDFFNYKPTPVYEHGIQLRDMVMLRYELGG
nr:Acetyltransferase (GNAT) family [uncultured bacterium]